MIGASSREDRVLIVDDEERNRKLIAGYLADDYVLAEAADGAEALQRLDTFEPDLVLLDVMMPGINGYEVCRQIKADPRHRSRQVMMLTALSGSRHTIEGLDTGADDFVSKPVRREEFLAKVRALSRARSLLLELEETTHRLAEANRELELKKTLAQAIVHDLKSPLQVVMGNLEILSRRIPGNDELTDRCRQAARRMHSMVVDLLDVEALSESRLTVQTKSVDAVQVTQDVIQELSTVASLSDVALDLDTVDGAWVEAEPLMLRRVLENLVHNALTHSRSRGSVETVVLPRPEGVEITVRDHGKGIPDGQEERIFEKYQQVEAASGRASANRGLGLTYCRLAVEAFGGTIWAENAPGGGARFRLVLPDAEAPLVDATSPGLPKYTG